MKAKIDERGWLSLERAGKIKEVYCPWTKDPSDFECSHCGDWCALFRIAEWNEVKIAVEMCKKTLFIDKDDFTDERGGE